MPVSCIRTGESKNNKVAIQLTQERSLIGNCVVLQDNRAESWYKCAAALDHYQTFFGHQSPYLFPTRKPTSNSCVPLLTVFRLEVV